MPPGALLAGFACCWAAESLRAGRPANEPGWSRHRLPEPFADRYPHAASGNAKPSGQSLNAGKPGSLCRQSFFAECP